MRRTFIDDDLQQQFEENGYVLFNSFLSKEEIEQLRTYYFKFENDLGLGFHATMHSNWIEYRENVNDFISNIFKPKADNLLDNYRALVANFTVKEPGNESFFDFHLDWNMVDENKCRSITIWTPLMDTNEQNGNLWILEKSHLLGESFRCGPGLALYFKDMDEVKKNRFRKRRLEMVAGDAIIYDHKLFHGSPPNLTNQPRLAINQAMAPADVPSLHYQEESKKRVAVYEVPDDYYCKCIIGQRINNGKRVGDIRMKKPPIPQKLVNKMIIE
ncbi:MAG: phytanoyl-CoA dioxygenase family protein [Chitinophagales bacterium]